MTAPEDSATEGRCERGSRGTGKSQNAKCKSELLIESNIVAQNMLESLCGEQRELTAILVSSVNTAKSQT